MVATLRGPKEVTYGATADLILDVLVLGACLPWAWGPQVIPIGSCIRDAELDLVLACPSSIELGGQVELGSLPHSLGAGGLAPLVPELSRQQSCPKSALLTHED